MNHLRPLRPTIVGLVVIAMTSCAGEHHGPALDPVASITWSEQPELPVLVPLIDLDERPDVVEVELVAGGTSRVSVASTATPSDAAVAAAVDEAGYDLVGAGR